jgi:hypothetical protein
MTRFFPIRAQVRPYGASSGASGGVSRAPAGGFRTSEKLIVAQTALAVGVASWAFGGGIWWAPALVAAVVCLCVIPLALSFREDRLSFAAAWPLLPWAGLLAVMAFSLANPSYRPMAPEEGVGFVLAEHWEALPSTVSPARTVEIGGLMAAILLQGVAVFRCLNRRRSVRLLLGLLCLNTLALALFGTVRHLLGAERIFGQEVPGYFFATFIYKNHWSAFALLSLCAAIGLLFHYRSDPPAQRGRSRNNPMFLFVAATALIALTVPLKQSRSGTVLLLVVLLALALRAVFAALASRRLSFGGRVGAAAGLAAAIGGFVWFGYTLAEPAVRGGIRRTEQQVSAYVERDQPDVRVHIARDTWTMAQAAPLWGWGAGSYPLVMPAYLGAEFRSRRTGELTQLAIDAHCDWLQFLAELGWVGFGLLLLTPASATVLYVAKGRGSPVSRWTLFGCGLILVYAIGDFPFQNPAVFLLFSVTAAAALKHGHLERGRSGVKGDRSQ